MPAVGSTEGAVLASLLITSDVTGQNAGANPFFVGQVRASKPFVHVLDETTLDILMGELDTVADFVAYLNKKEAFMTRPGRMFWRVAKNRS